MGELQTFTRNPQTILVVAPCRTTPADALLDFSLVLAIFANWRPRQQRIGQALNICSGRKQAAVCDWRNARMRTCTMSARSSGGKCEG